MRPFEAVVTLLFSMLHSMFFIPNQVSSDKEETYFHYFETFLALSKPDLYLLRELDRKRRKSHYY